jgi:bifunctional non-homologous end joining protein LigD
MKTFEAALVKEVHVDTAILDGELVVTDHLGRTMFADLMKQRKLARYFAFDLLSLNGEDLTKLPLLRRKEKLKRILPSRSAHVLYVDHSRGNGSALYRLACQLDLTRLAYSQKEGPADLLKRAG